jgi:hypothetical protein
MWWYCDHYLDGTTVRVIRELRATELLIVRGVGINTCIWKVP